MCHQYYEGMKISIWIDINNFNNKTMFELILFVSVLFVIFLFYKELYPFIRKYFKYRNEREELVKKYNRIWRSRNDMLVNYIINYNISIIDALWLGDSKRRFTKRYLTIRKWDWENGSRNGRFK